MPRHSTLTDLQRLVRAYGLLAGTCDNERAIIGPISRRWIASEVEHPIPLDSLSPAFFRTQRGKDLLATELYPDEDIDPECIDPDALDLGVLLKGRMINSNRVPKLEPRINCSVLVANMLLGVRLYGRHGKGVTEISHDLIIAAMLQDALEKPYVFSSLSSAEHELVDCEYVKTWFGPTVSLLAYQIRSVLLALESADEVSTPAPRVANALAAIFASRLRLTARGVGDAVISFLDEDRLVELHERGIATDGDFPERDVLQRDFDRASAALALPGVDHYALREPIRTTLLVAVSDALEDPARRDRLSGRRGKAVHELHLNLPVMENYVASESPNALETVHLASLEMMRSLEKGRRKSLSTMIAHAFRISAFAERVLGDALEPLVVTLAMLHDVVEDGSVRVTGYDHSLQKIMFRFGAPIAAMVSELTDSSVKTAGAHKARVTYEQPHLLSPEHQYNVNRFTELDLRPSDGRQPYTLSGIVIKLLDTVVSLEEGIRDPELMTDWWRHSGARIYWADAQRGSIIYPLIERLVIELKSSKSDPAYAKRRHSVTQLRLKAGMALLETTLNYLDMYATQNLAILADEYQLDASQREFLLRSFNDANITEERFTTLVLEPLLNESRLRTSIAAGRVPAKCYVVLFPKSATADAEPELATLLSYRRNALRRQAIRDELLINTADRLSTQALRQQQIIAMYDLKMSETELKCTVANAG
ncbi:MAG: hypothetical protein KTR33_10970 [Gammaproteobacteria bacterium]|nr:hypothetical protein [Gammaproteobacteria bacterium]